MEVGQGGWLSLFLFYLRNLFEITFFYLKKHTVFIQCQANGGLCLILSTQAKGLYRGIRCQLNQGVILKLHFLNILKLVLLCSTHQ